MEYNLFLTGCGHAYWYGVPPCQIPLFCLACLEPLDDYWKGHNENNPSPAS